MTKMWKKTFAFLLALVMSVGGMSITAFATENSTGNVCKIQETGVEYATLTAAFDAANATEDADTIVLLKDIDFDSTKALSVTGKIIITGDHTISRGSYTGTMFSVPVGASLILDGITVDGNNNWTIDSETFKNDVIAGKTVDGNSTNYHKLEEGAPVATASMFVINGSVVINNDATIQNNAGATLFSVEDGGYLETNDALITKNYKKDVEVVASVKAGGKWVINDGTVISENYCQAGNGGLCRVMGTAIIDGGLFANNYSSGNGSIFMVYKANSYLEFNDGLFTENYCLNHNGNNWNGVIHVHYDGPTTFVMNGGAITGNYGSYCGGLSASKGGKPATIILNGGTITDNVSALNGRDVTLGQNITIAGNVTVGEVKAYRDVTVNADATMTVLDTLYLWKNGAAIAYSGTGTVNGNVYLYNGVDATMNSGSWVNGVVTVNAIGTESTLIVKPDANIDGKQIRVLDSVASGAYTNAEEAVAAQAASYVEEAGANVKSPVLYFHRLTSAQKSNVVVTYDYNGGLDAQGWSGCQLTNAESFIPESPAPVKDGYEFIGWKYAVENDPESLSMEGTADYNGEAIATSLRLIAQWYNGVEKTLEINKITEIGEGNTKLTYPLEGIEFEIYYVGTVDEYTDYVKAYVAANGSADEKTIQDAFAAEKAAGVSENDILEVATTDITGKAVSKFREDGIYLIIEREHPAIVEPLDPFVVALPMSTTTTEGTNELVYNVTINPKNEVVPGPEVNKNVTALDTEIDSFAVGDVVTWILRGEVPADIANGKSYVMTDVLDDWLDYANNVKVVVANGEEETELSAEDYEYTFDSNTKTFEFELTKVGMKTVADAEEAAKAELEIRVYLDTTLNTKASVGDKVPNEVKLEYTSSVNFYYEDVDDAAAYTCGISIYKYDAKNKATALAGAKFILAKAVSEDTDGAVTLVTNRKEVDYVIYEEFYTSINAEGELDGLANEIVTDENGVAKIYGLDEGKYYLVETQAPEGYNLLSYPVEINVLQHSDEAPIEVANSNQFKLPATGGVGTTIFTVSGACLMAAAAVMLVMKKRKEEMI